MKFKGFYIFCFVFMLCFYLSDFKSFAVTNLGGIDWNNVSCSDSFPFVYEISYDDYVRLSSRGDGYYIIPVDTYFYFTFEAMEDLFTDEPCTVNFRFNFNLPGIGSFDNVVYEYSLLLGGQEFVLDDRVFASDGAWINRPSASFNGSYITFKVHFKGDYSFSKYNVTSYLGTGSSFTGSNYLTPSASLVMFNIYDDDDLISLMSDNIKSLKMNNDGLGEKLDEQNRLQEEGNAIQNEINERQEQILEDVDNAMDGDGALSEDSIGDYESAESTLTDYGFDELNDFSFDIYDFSRQFTTEEAPAVISAMAWISVIIEKLFVANPYSPLFGVTLALLLACVLAGLHRLWR